ncbi:MAG: YhgE/Pip family protein [Microbacteriaceae bacterium]
MSIDPENNTPSRPDRVSRPSAVSRLRLTRRIATVAAVFVPLAFAGLITGALSTGDSDEALIPAALVNNDEMVSAEDAGGDQPVLAGRLLVTELTAPGTSPFEWSLSNSEDAEAALEAGEVYAVLTVPDDFSRSITSLSTDDPQRAEISIRTDDAHNYLTGALAEAVGDGMAATFGQEITARYVAGLYSSVGTLGGALTEAADGASQLADGATGLSGGLTEFSAGLDSYTSGVGSLSSGLAQLDSGAASLDRLSGGVRDYTAGISQLSAALSGTVAQLMADPGNPHLLGTVQALSGQLQQASAAGPTLSSQTTTAIDSVQGGISDSADGASELAASSGALNDAVGSMETGAGELAGGLGTLADGLATGAGALPPADEQAISDAAEIAASPVAISVERENPVADVGHMVATLFVPLGLWIGSLAAVLLLRPLSRDALASTASSWRLSGRQLFRASAVTAAQALLLVGLLHLAIGVSWESLPATLGVAVLTALAFTAFHVLLAATSRPVALVVSLFLLALQIASTGGLYPAQVLAEPFQAIGPFLPLTWAVTAMQSVVTGGAQADALTAVVALALFGVVSALLATAVTARKRRTQMVDRMLQTA